MKFLRYKLRGDDPCFGWIYEDYVGRIEGSLFGEFRRLEADIPFTTVHVLSPVLPQKIIGVVGNFMDSGQKELLEIPAVPTLFYKPQTALIGPFSAVRLPPQTKIVTPEIHLAVVIGQGGRWIQPADARAHILGYTVAIDFTAQDLEAADRNLVRAKSFDTFLALGPWIETELNTLDTLLTCRVANELRQMASTREMIFPIDRLVAFISSFMTLSPGDVILSGSPGGSSPVQEGDRIEAVIEGIGSLVVQVKQEQTS
jgi:2-keto-4-pentenoate hydratase/2-oxohepta-3-ene-1,7-dioic acid hydratase in catechol pathway